MIRIAVLDDEPIFTEKILEAVECFLRTEQIVYSVKCYHSPSELLWDLQENEYFDIFFLDIEMKISGLDVAAAIRDLYGDAFILFVTNYIQYSIKGYEYNAYRYIIKEDISEKLPIVLKQIYEILKERGQKYYIIESATKILKLPYSEIFYFYVQGKYICVITRSGSRKIRKSLRKLYNELDTEEFIYIDKGTVVNVTHVKALEEHTVHMFNGASLAVSTSRIKGLKQAISRYWRNKV